MSPGANAVLRSAEDATAATEAAPLLSVDGLTVDLPPSRGGERRVRVCDDVGFSIHPGETLALLGESGCGKSMTALSLMRLLPLGGRVVAGSVRLGDTDLLRLTERDMRRIRGGRMAMIFQEPQTSLNPVLTVGAQIAEAVRVHEGMRRGAIPGRVVELLRAVGIPDPQRRVEEYPHQLSGGMKQRVMIAMALAGDPELLIADEPTTALDVTIQAQVLQLLRGVQRERGMAVLLITHDLGVVAETADRLAVMYAGQIVEHASVEAFFAGPAHPYSRKLMESLPDAAKRTGELAVIPGRVPPLDRDFDGCRFADRCFRVMDRCRDTVPDWFDAGASQRVRCLLWDGATPEFAPPAAAPVPPAAGRVQASTSSVLLRVEDLKVHFPIRRGLFKRTVGHVRAVDGVDLSLYAGGTLALVGESGCGKTTVGKGILQLESPTAGAVHYDGVDLARLAPGRLRAYRKELQIIFQDPFASMNPRMLVEDIVGEGLQALGLTPSRAERRKRVAALLEQVGIGEQAMGRYPHEFSGGQRQRICIARALAVAPKLIVCDEPTSALDVSVQAQILNLLKHLQKELGLAYLFITHDLSVVSYLADEVAVMYLGRIVERGRTEQILADPRHPYTKALLSAVPIADPSRRRDIIRLGGDMPSPANPPAGCHFHPRCPESTQDCAAAYPDVRRLADGRTVRCIRVEDD
jgi:peptide/nickel transport system ATP-binding protein